jgi:hypothetical protein
MLTSAPPAGLRAGCVVAYRRRSGRRLKREAELGPVLVLVG